MKHLSRFCSACVHIGGPILVVAAFGFESVSGRAATPEKAAAPASSGAEQPAIEPDAKQALTRMSDFFQSLSAFAAREDVTRDLVINDNLKVQKTSTWNVWARKPGQLRIDVVGDDEKNQSLFFDGKTLTVYMRTPHYYAQMDVPGKIGGAIDMAESRYGVEFPLSDLLRAVPNEEFSKDLKAAGRVGRSMVGNDPCDHFAYRNSEVDYQLWIQSGDKPLLRKLVITSKKEPTQPQYTAVITWDLSPKIEDSFFAFAPPQGATRIEFGAPPPEATKPPAGKK